MPSLFVQPMMTRQFVIAAEVLGPELLERIRAVELLVLRLGIFARSERREPLFCCVPRLFEAEFRLKILFDPLARCRFASDVRLSLLGAGRSLRQRAESGKSGVFVIVSR